MLSFNVLLMPLPMPFIKNNKQKKYATKNYGC